MAKTEYVKIRTGPFKAQWPELFEAKSFEGNDPKFSIKMLFPKDKLDIKKLKNEVRRVANDLFGDKKPHGFIDPIKDGDNLFDKEGNEVEETKGYWVVKAQTSRQPGVVDSDRTTITMKESDKVYSGCWCRATLVAKAYDYINRGVTFYLNNVQKLRDDTPLVPQNDPADDFADDDDSDNGSDGDGW